MGNNNGQSGELSAPVYDLYSLYGVGGFLFIQGNSAGCPSDSWRGFGGKYSGEDRGESQDHERKC